MNKFTFLKQILTSLFIFITLNTFSQMEVSMENVEYLNNPIANCNPINFNSSTSHSISFDAKIEVVSYDNGPVLTYGNLIIAYWTGSAEEIYQTISLNEYDWVYDTSQSKAYYELPRNITLNSSDFDDTNGGRVYLRYEESINQFYKESCKFNITKPKFSISPNNVSVLCGNSSHKTFYVNNDNNSPGDIEYEWNLGSGWNHQGSPVSSIITTSNQISLTPNAFPPSDVKVTPVLDYVDYPQLISNIELSEFNPDNGIIGNNFVCSTVTYSVNYLPYGVTVASWSVSDSSLATITTNGNQATLTATGNGTISITAILTNVCGQTKPIVKNNIYVGAPDFSPYPAMSGENSPITGDYLWYSVGAASDATSYDWYFDMGNGVTGTHVGGWEILQYGYQNRSIFVKVGNPGTTVLVCRANNNCGNRLKYKYVAVRSVNSPCEGELKFSSNPMKKGDRDNNVIYPPIDPCDFDPLNKMATNNKTMKTVEIFNSYGELVYLKSQTDDRFNVSELKKGLYIVKSQMPNGKTITKKLIVK